ncbi:diaminopimelate epimerase [Lacrimispora saccharolytica]|uniref:Diaminopimelate epimerase n=1 Tax=Lacrimispora saccharolytica (strain ATCC 35040 / DSM 2544 / NRCC 2533 / WM1) TaxID=610130 RepID=D9R8C5_LACSW|nr:diaminopimelate epimerase [Lacrimispora saccharolytica]ADL03877.1 diaminopimelate epimerase [[Clostridium] saccharolyticum WM1]QRV22094.1 diaminopimelate epimerase [Lacrimispora saccharolytica]
MKFTKMQGIGNDYVYINCFEEIVETPEKLAKKVSDRHFGIGSDGLILICPSETADCRMRMFNADGSESQMCGNGIRCVGKYVYDHGLVEKTEFNVETGAGIKHLKVSTEDGKAVRITVDMGVPEVTSQVPEPIWVNGMEYEFIGISMGNPHAIYYMDFIDGLDLEAIGPAFEHHERFPERTNSEFIQVVNRNYIRMRVWERGSGETWACGTGAAASAVASALSGRTAHMVEVELKGGNLTIHWDREGSGHVFMTGPAVEVFEGEFDINNL